MNWFDRLPPAETSLPCGDGTHTIRWEAGRLSLPGHPDAEAELILGALGGDKPACRALAEIWDKHRDDLAVLMAGPRGPADRVSVTWDQAKQLRASRLAIGRAGGTGTFTRMRTAPGGPRLPRTLQYSARGVMTSSPTDGELAHQAERQSEVLRLLALGPAFQFRLSGAVAASWAADSRLEDRARHRPALTAALTGRFAPVAGRWLGIDPAAVTITPHEGPGWGSLTITGAGTGRRLSGSLPVSWLSDVWACGLALVDDHLTVAVEQSGYPRARALALPAPGANPVALDVEAEEAEADGAAAGGPAPIPRWHRATR